MNQGHIDLCGSDEWADVVRDQIVPWVLEDIDLGDAAIEIGPGPGRTTDVVRHLVDRLTVVELDPVLAATLRDRLDGSNVVVDTGDATDLAFDAGVFSAALSFNMLHHVPTPEMQDQVLAELARVVRPGGVLAAVDSRPSEELRAFHDGDTYVPVHPDTLPARLQAAGWRQIEVTTNGYATRFRGTAPG